MPTAAVAAVLAAAVIMYVHSHAACTAEALPDCCHHCCCNLLWHVYTAATPHPMQADSRV
eukprot:11762-Heterococcus_DN1.PRE.4